MDKQLAFGNRNWKSIGVDKFKAFYTLTIVLFLPLSIYSSGIATLSIADVLLIISTAPLFIIVLYEHSKNRRFAYLALVPFVGYILLGMLLTIESSMLRTLRFAFYLIVVILFSKDYIRFKLLIKSYIGISIIATIFIIIQYISFEIFHHYISGYIPFFQLANDEFALYADRIYESSIIKARMRSFFGEPSHYAAYVATGVVFVFLYQIKDRARISLFLTIGVIISASATGILMLALVWIVHATKVLLDKFTHQQLLFGFFILLLIIAVAINLQSFHIFLSRMIDGNSVAGRFGGYQSLASNDVLSFFIGNGMVIQEDVYLAGWARMLDYFGIIGILLYVVPLVITSKDNYSSSILLIFFFILNTGSSIMLSGSMICYLAIVIIQSNRSLTYTI